MFRQNFFQFKVIAIFVFIVHNKTLSYNFKFPSLLKKMRSLGTCLYELSSRPTHKLTFTSKCKNWVIPRFLFSCLILQIFQNVTDLTLNNNLSMELFEN